MSSSLEAGGGVIGWAAARSPFGIAAGSSASMAGFSVEVAVAVGAEGGVRVACGSLDRKSVV
jgi:hypothetical protein